MSDGPDLPDEWRYSLVNVEWVGTELRIDARDAADGRVYSHVFDAADAAAIAREVVLEGLTGGSDA